MGWGESTNREIDFGFGSCVRAAAGGKVGMERKHGLRRFPIVLGGQLVSWIIQKLMR